MEWISDDDFTEAVDQVILQPTLVQGWLGYGSVLFIGFGDHILPPIVRGIGLSNQERPIYRLKTSMCYWKVLDENKSILGHSEGEREMAEATLASVVGLQVSEYEIYTNFALDIQFLSGVTLAIRPYSENTGPESDLWGVREPDGFYSFVRCDGKMYRVYEHESALEGLDEQERRRLYEEVGQQGWPRWRVEELAEVIEKDRNTGPGHR